MTQTLHASLFPSTGTYTIIATVKYYCKTYINIWLDFASHLEKGVEAIPFEMAPCNSDALSRR